ncbi:MAG: hypothetical protein GWP61_23405 [Chloroflexi bacterium]|jgi:hypothetical protein|nr:hypothetical protein [Chloroflexota bacterium]
MRAARSVRVVGAGAAQRILPEMLVDSVAQRYNPWLTPEERREFELD